MALGPGKKVLMLKVKEAREGQVWSVLSSKVFEGNNKIAEITAALLWHRRVIMAATEK